MLTVIAVALLLALFTGAFGWLVVVAIKGGNALKEIEEAKKKSGYYNCK